VKSVFPGGVYVCETPLAAVPLYESLLAASPLTELHAWAPLRTKAPKSRPKPTRKKELAALSSMPASVPLTEEEPWHSQGVHKMVVGNFLAYF
jgi:hypothetical protein